jgi:hypothetical protein
MEQNLFVFYSEILLFLGIISMMKFNKNSISNYSLLWITISSIPIFFFYYIIFINTVNIPFQDDYSLLDSIYQMETSTTFVEWLKAFFKQINQHRFGFEKGVMWLIYRVFNSENIKVQIIIGNSFLLGILFLLLKIFDNYKLPILYFIPIPLLLFNLTYFENAIWGIAAIQNTPIIFFALLTVYFLSLNSIKYFYWALIFATITLFTSGNGIAVWLVGILIIIFQKNWKNLIIWAVMMFCFFTVYFIFDYEIISSDRTNLLKHPFFNFQYLLTFWGNIFFQNIPHPDVGHRYLDIFLCIVTGSFLAIIIIGLLVNIYKNSFQGSSKVTINLFGGMLFLACTGLMLVLSRPTEVNVLFGGEILSRRYMIFGAVFLCIGYLSYLFLTMKNKNFQKLGLITFLLMGLFINISSYYTSLSDVYKQKEELKLDGYYWKNHRMLLSFGEKYGEKIGYNHPTYMIDLINKLDSSGIYKLSQSEILPLISLIKRTNYKSAKVFEGKIDTSMSIGKTIGRENKERILFKGNKKSGNQHIKYVVLKSQQNIFLLPCVPVTNSILKCLSTQKLYSSDFNYETWKAKFPVDNYEVWVLEKDNQNNYIPLYCRKNLQL